MSGNKTNRVRLLLFNEKIILRLTNCFTQYFICVKEPCADELSYVKLSSFCLVIDKYNI
jgi:hypothetical protein